MEVRGAFLGGLPGDGPPHVGVLLDNVPEYLFLIGGATLSGRVLVGINPTRRGAELAGDIRHADCQVVITDTGHAGLLDDLDLGAATGRVLIADSPAYTEALAPHRRPGAPPSTAMPIASDLLLLIFTSGSTGAPKAVRVTQGAPPGRPRAKCPSGPTTSSTARCPSSTATR